MFTGGLSKRFHFNRLVLPYTSLLKRFLTVDVILLEVNITSSLTKYFQALTLFRLCACKLHLVWFNTSFHCIFKMISKPQMHAYKQLKFMKAINPY